MMHGKRKGKSGFFLLFNGFVLVFVGGGGEDQKWRKNWFGMGVFVNCK